MPISGWTLLNEITWIPHGPFSILTALSANRILYLIAEEGLDFEAAKSQAEKEVLAIFKINDPAPAPFEEMDILREGDNNAKLLAVSVIMMQMAHSENNSAVTAALSEIIAQIKIDMEEDGGIDIFNSLTEKIEKAIQAINALTVRSHLEEIYQAMDPSIVIPEFERYLAGNIIVDWTADCREGDIAAVEARIYDVGLVLSRQWNWQCQEPHAVEIIESIRTGTYETSR